MIVSNGESTFFRGDFRTKISRNMDFIDIHISDGGRDRIIGVSRRHLMEALKLENQGDSIEGTVTYDIPADVETCTKIFGTMLEQVERMKIW